MSAFEYASGLISIVVGLAVARVLGGIGTFTAASKRATSDWIMASWCLALLLLMVGWWMMGWVTLRLQTEIPFSTLFIWIVATALLYLAAFVLVLLVGLTQETFAVTDQVASTTGIPTLLPPATMAGLSAVGAALNSERDRAFHLLAWLAVLALVIGQSALTIG